MATSISSIGAGSGLPLNQLLNDLRTSENQALTLIKTRYEATQNRISAYGTLKNAVETVKTAAENIKILSERRTAARVRISQPDRHRHRRRFVPASARTTAAKISAAARRELWRTPAAANIWYIKVSSADVADVSNIADR